MKPSKGRPQRWAGMIAAFLPALPALLVPLLLVLLVLPGSVQAQAWPARPLHIVVGFPPGNTLDSVARLAAEHLRVKLGQPVIIDNKPGANGLLAAAEVARAPADGYTLLAINSSGLMVNPLVYRKAGYQLTDFTPVTMFTSLPFFLVVNPANPRTAALKSLNDFVVLARAKPDDLRYGSGGIGNFGSLTFQMLANSAGFKATHVPYKGTSAAQAGLLGQEIDALLDTPLAVPQIKAGRLNALAVTSATRWRDLPEVPTVQEAGVANFDITVWLALMAPAGTPPAVVAAVQSALASIRDDPNLVRQFQVHGTLEMTAPAEFGARLKAESALWSEIIRRENIQLD